jgi:hypothetical protein
VAILFLLDDLKHTDFSSKLTANHRRRLRFEFE